MEKENLERRRWIALAAGILILFGLFVWPTLYRYDRYEAGQTEYPMRINRLTGSSEVLYPKSTSTMLPPYALAQLTGTLSLGTDLRWSEAAPETNGTLHCNLYNGSDWSIETVRVAVTLKSSWGFVEFADREYDLRMKSKDASVRDLEAKSGAEFMAEDPTLRNLKSRNLDWKIISAVGRPPESR